jgi:hypothetical protein
MTDVRDIAQRPVRPLMGRVAAALCLALSGCSGPSLIVLQHPTSGEIIACGPPPDAPSADPSGEARTCAARYEQAGYRKLPLDSGP